jgi:hypothetical protein
MKNSGITRPGTKCVAEAATALNKTIRKNQVQASVLQSPAEPEALRAVIKEWLVPLLVQQFLDGRARITVNSRIQTPGPMSKEGAATSRIQ